MADAYWQARIIYESVRVAGSLSVRAGGTKTENFIESEEAEARDWIETSMEEAWTVTQDGIEYTFPSSSIHHAQLQFFEEVIEE